MGILLAILFILQMISFMVITLLYMKVAKFNNLEKKQQKLMEEMDRSVTVYLEEIKEENNRLIEQLDRRTEAAVPQPSSEAARQPDVPVYEPPKPRPIPVHTALRTYQQNKTPAIQPEVKAESELGMADEPAQVVRQTAIKMHAEGKSVQEIAKELGKGQTEIELLLKFG